jgi:hypothetical protein
MATPGRGRGFPEEERLPWLDPAELHARRKATRRSAMIPVVVVLLLAAVGAVLLARHWLAPPVAVAGAPGLIRAPQAPYKIKPADPGGMDVEGAGFASYEASEGEDPAGRLDLGAVPEAPVATPKQKPAAAEPVAVPELPVRDVAGGGYIQLGAFSSNAKAQAAWKALIVRFRFLGAMEPIVQQVEVGGETRHRLRAAAGVNAAAMCGRLKVAGETCLVVR